MNVVKDMLNNLSPGYIVLISIIVVACIGIGIGVLANTGIRELLGVIRYV